MPGVRVPTRFVSKYTVTAQLGALERGGLRRMSIFIEERPAARRADERPRRPSSSCWWT